MFTYRLNTCHDGHHDVTSLMCWKQCFHSTVGDVTSLDHDARFSRRKLGSFDIMSLVWVRFVLQNNKSVLIVAWFQMLPGMADLIRIKQMYIYSLFCRASRSFKGWVKFPRLAPMHGRYSALCGVCNQPWVQTQNRKTQTSVRVKPLGTRLSIRQPSGRG
jgi:hypothetical protein